MITLRLIVFALGVIGIVISMPLLGFAVLGYFGILADMSVEENRQIGMQLLFLGLPALFVGVFLCVLGLFAKSGSHQFPEESENETQ